MLKKEQLTLKHNWSDHDKSENLGIREIYKMLKNILDTEREILTDTAEIIKVGNFKLS